MTPDVHEPATDHRAILEDLQRRAVQAYGEARAADSTFQSVLALAARAVWRVTQEPLEPSTDEP